MLQKPERGRALLTPNSSNCQKRGGHCAKRSPECRRKQENHRPKVSQHLPKLLNTTQKLSNATQKSPTPPKTHSTPPQTHSTPPKIHITCHDSTFYDIRKRAFWARISPAENSQRLRGYVLSRYSLLLPLSKATKRQLYDFSLKSSFFRAESSFSRT